MSEVPTANLVVLPRSGVSANLLGRTADASALVILVWLSGETLTRTGISSELWILLYGYAGIRILLAPAEFIHVLSKNIALLAIGIVACLSVTWSILPARTMVASTQFMMTILLGCYFGSQFDLQAILKLVFIATGLALLISAVNLTGIFGKNYVPSGGFIGIFSSKNLFAQQVGFFMICCLALTIIERKTWARFALLTFLIVAAYFLGISKSIASIAAALMSIMFIIVVYFGSGPPVLRFFLITGLIVAGTFCSLFALVGDTTITQFLEYIGKDSTLTGRLDLWKIGFSHFREEPFTGLGYGAYWQHPQFFAEIEYARATFGETVNAFHNFVIEALVALGGLALVPLALFCITPIFRCLALMKRSGQFYTASSVLGLMFYSIILASFGPLLLRQHETTVWLFPAIAVAAQKSMEQFQGSDK